jgi:hypothetical protein
LRGTHSTLLHYYYNTTVYTSDFCTAMDFATMVKELQASPLSPPPLTPSLFPPTPGKRGFQNVWQIFRKITFYAFRQRDLKGTCAMKGMSQTDFTVFLFF